MKLRSRRFILLILGTIVLPIFIYVIFSVSKLKENEQVIEQIYKEQLDAIIFSINQYSTDVLSSMIDQIETNFKNQTPEKEYKEVMRFTGVNALYLHSMVSDAKFDNLVKFEGSSVQESLLDSIYEANQPLIRKLDEYLEAGYRKIEPIPVKLPELGQLFFAIIQDAGGKNYLLAGLIDPGQYIPEILSPKLQQVSNEELIVAFSDDSQDNILFSTDSLTHDVFMFEKMWLFSNIRVGLSSKTKTVSELVADRLKANLIASGLLVLLLITGVTLIIRNLNKEMKLTQNKSDFVSNVSHELRTPLALISMFAETLSLNRVKSEDQRKEYTEIIHRETTRLTHIVNRILNFSKIEANQREYRFVTFDLTELIRGLLSDYSYHMNQHGFAHTASLPDQPLLITADQEAVYEAVVNLLDNAIKYSPENKEIDISVIETESNAQIKIKDQGVGIPTDKLQDIFDKFYRVTEGDLYTVKGTGLGLSIVKHIMDAHRGMIDVTSEVGKGSTFTLTFLKKSDA